ncbi:hypothetical protein F5883DRAFT_565043 [Diaporthe sp. PMI_573]|nr:hypothetical protein F5883DRAFT_565043 [Diaporthaceae sp. PMI_573]
MGATLTTTRQHGNLFIAFTAFFVGFVASRFWKMVCLATHRYYSSSQQEDALHHQRQAVLRNSGSSLEGLWMFTRLAWVWRSSARRCLLRMLPAIISASFLLASFSIAGGFSSQISSAVGSDVLLDGSNCGVFTTVGAAGTVQAASILYSNVAQKTEQAANYTRQCYSSSRSGMLDCTSFIVDHLSSTVDTRAPCPFPGADVCRLQNSNLRLGTGLLDSNDFFGLNAPQSQRILFRNVLECAPLVTEPFAQNISTSLNYYTVYNYGPNFLGRNYTYQPTHQHSERGG